MAFSIQQAMDEFFNNSGGGGIKYGGTGISGGYGSIAGGSTKKGGGAGSGSADGGTGKKGGGSSSDIGKNGSPDAGAGTTVKLPFNPADYKHMHVGEPFPDGSRPIVYYNGTYQDETGRTRRCDGWYTIDNTDASPIQSCPTIKNKVYDWFFHP